jgi:short-subunit dehydrogenase
MAVYYATKAYVLSFSEALASECAGTGVTVTALCPGPTRTEFEGRAGSPEEITVRKKGFVMSASQVARDGWKGMKTGKRLVIPGVKNRLLVQLERATPRRIVTAISRRIREPRT